MSQMSDGLQPGRSMKTKMEKVLGEYSILAELARGGMGRVYLARRSGHAGFERHFAIKVMHQALNDDPKWVNMLLDEAHIASKIHHPNVVPVIDVGMFGDSYYLVMDYVEGCSLQQLLKKSPEDRPVRAIVSILLDSLRGLQTVHTLRGEHDEELHVVHRDVSPHNLLLGVDGCCRVTDFGIAKANHRSTETGVDTHKGKLAYMAPEQLRGLPSLDARADVWAAGVTLYEAFTGVHPFRQDNDRATIQSIIRGEIALPSSVGLMPPSVFDEVIMRSLQRDPDARYRTAEQFAETLRAAALEAEVLGSSSDVASWVNGTYGLELATRRRKLSAIPKSSDDTVTSATSSLPKLWFLQDGGTTSASSSGSQIIVGTGFRAASSSFTTLANSQPRVITSMAMLAVAVVIGVSVFLTKGIESESVHEQTAQLAPVATASSTLPAAIAVPEMKPVSDLPLAAAPTEPRSALEVNREPQLLATGQDSPTRRGRVVAPPKFRKATPTGSSDAIVTSAKQALSGLRDDAAAVRAVHTSAPAPAATLHKAQGLDPNPYQLGE